MNTLRRKFPHGAIESAAGQGGADILVAGCDTGRNAIETAQGFKGARVLAVDLSLNSLGHAARKTRECGVGGSNMPRPICSNWERWSGAST